MRRTSPQLHARLIARPRPLALLEHEHAARIVSITAPAGYGKTTLGAMWMRRLAAAPPADSAPVEIWLTCGAADDEDVVRLVEQIVGALAAAATPSHAAAAVVAAVRSTPGAAVPSLAAFVRALAESPRTVFLAFDDLHLIRSDAALHVLQTVIDAAPHNLHLLLLSRSLPALQLPPNTLHLSADDLRFDHDEFLRYVHGTRLAALGEPDIASLEQRAGGWITALQLFSIAPAGAVRDSDAHSTPALQRDFIAEYFERFVLHSQPEPLQNFLLHTAPLTAFDAALAARVLDVSTADCAAFIETALSANLFLQAYAPASERLNAEIDPSPTYAYHPLFREFLKQRFLDIYGKPAFDAHLSRIGAVFAAQNDVDSALDFLLRAGEVARARAVLAAHGRRALLRGEHMTLLRWFERFTDADIESSPALAFEAAWLSQVLGDASRRPATDRARRALTHASDAAAFTSSLLTLEALTCYFEGRTTEAQSFTDAAFDAPPPGDPLAAGYRWFARALLPLDPGNWRERIDALAEANELFLRAEFPHGMIVTAAMRSASLRRCGDGAGALYSLESLMKQLDERYVNYSTNAIDTYVAYGETLYWVDKFEEAATYYRRALAVRPVLAEMEYSIHKAEVHLTSIALLTGAPAEFDAHADQATWRRIVASSSPVGVGALALQRVLRDFQRGDEDGCRRTLDIAGIDRSTKIDIARVAALSIDVLFGRTPSDALSDALAEMLAASRTPTGRLTHMRAAALYALSLENAGRPDDAEAVMRDVLPLVRTSLMHRLLLDYAPIGAVLKRIRDPFAQRLYLRLHPEEAPFDLSRAELRVLRLAASGLQMKEIAAQLDRRTDTVSKHLVHAYRKLGVDNRADAMQILRSVGLIE